MKEPVKWLMDEHGVLEGYDEDGHLVSTGRPRKGSRLEKAKEEGLPAPKSRRKDVRPRSRNGLGFLYSKSISAEIIQRVIEGETITSIARDPEMPKRQKIHEWLALHKEFKVQYDEAKKLRAECYADKAIHEAESCTDPKEVPVHKLRIDTYKWAAGVGNPNEYHPRPKEENQGTIFVINTGIRRDEKPVIDIEKVTNEED